MGFELLINENNGRPLFILACDYCNKVIRDLDASIIWIDRHASGGEVERNPNYLVCHNECSQSVINDINKINDDDPNDPDIKMGLGTLIGGLATMLYSLGIDIREEKLPERLDS